MDNENIKHPGVHLKNLLTLLGISQIQVCREVGIHKTILNEIIAGKRSISASIALKLEDYSLGTAAHWMNLQSAYMLFKKRKTKQL